MLDGHDETTPAKPGINLFPEILSLATILTPTQPLFVSSKYDVSLSYDTVVREVK